MTRRERRRSRCVIGVRVRHDHKGEARRSHVELAIDVGEMLRSSDAGVDERRVAARADDEVRVVASSGHRAHVGPIAPFPGPLDGRLAVPHARPPVRVSLDVAELEVTGAIVLKFEECLDLLVEVVLISFGHGDDVPQAREWRLRLSS